MTDDTDTPPQRQTSVATSEIADLLAWTRRLADAGRHADPGERAAYQAAKDDLLARLTRGHHHTGHHIEGGTD